MPTKRCQYRAVYLHPGRGVSAKLFPATPKGLEQARASVAAYAEKTLFRGGVVEKHCDDGTATEVYECKYRKAKEEAPRCKVIRVPTVTPPNMEPGFVGRGAKLVRLSKNRKLGPRTSSTYTSMVDTCSDCCPMKRDPVTGKIGGCYGDDMRDKVIPKPIGSPRIVGRLEAMELAAAAGPTKTAYVDRPVRMHSAGDTPDLDSAELLAEAGRYYRAQGGGPIWNYTHRWHEIPRWVWGNEVSTLGSIEDPRQVPAVQAQGYAPALIVEKFPAKEWDEGGVHWIACPAQLYKETTCADCKKCWNDGALRRHGKGIAFEAHGSNTTKPKMIQVLRRIRAQPYLPDLRKVKGR